MTRSTSDSDAVNCLKPKIECLSGPLFHFLKLERTFQLFLVLIQAMFSFEFYQLQLYIDLFLACCTFT